MLEIFICEDNLTQRIRLERMIEKYVLIEDLDMKISLSTDNPYDLLAYIEQHPQSHAIFFLDVDLNKEIDGIELGGQIRNLCVDGKIIFITTHDELLPLTFKYKVEAMDYIIKEDQEELENRVREALQQTQRHYTSESSTTPSNRIRIEVGNQTRLFNLEDIMFIETSPTSHKLILHLSNSQTEFYGKITEIEQLSESFLRVHKSFVANQENIVHVNRKNRTLTFRNGETCWASTRQISILNQAFRTK